MKTPLLIPLVLVGGLATAPAAVLVFDLEGKAGAGLLPGNENHIPASSPTGTPPGTGGEVGAGITFDDVTRILTINVAWGSGNGFTDLTGNATMAHIHGVTADAPPTGFSQNAGVLYNLHTETGWNNNAINGGIFGTTVTLSALHAAALLEGKLYINVHTSANGPGEIRGNLVLVPEPETCALGMLGVAGLFAWLRHRQR